MYAHLLSHGTEGSPFPVIRVVLDHGDLAELHPGLSRPAAAPLTLPLYIDHDDMPRLAPWLVSTPPPPPTIDYQIRWCPTAEMMASLWDALTTINPQETDFPLAADLRLLGQSLADVRRLLGLRDPPDIQLNLPVSDETIAHLRALEEQQQRAISALTLEVLVDGPLLAELRRQWGFPAAFTSQDESNPPLTHRMLLH